MVALVAIASATAFVAAFQQVVRLFQVSHLAGTCAVTTGPHCRRLDVPGTVASLLSLDRRGNNPLLVLYALVAGSGRVARMAARRPPAGPRPFRFV